MYIKSVVLLLALCSASFTQEPDQVSVEALAVLQRAADVREETEGFTAELEYEIVGQGTHSFLLYLRGDKLRVDEFEGKSFADTDRVSTTLIKGDEAWYYHFTEFSDLERCTKSMVRKTGSNAFSPLAIGLSFILDLEDDMRELLYSDADAIVKQYDETREGVKVSHIEVSRRGVVLGYRIDVASGRVFEVISFKDQKERAGVRSKFEGNTGLEWMPSEVIITLRSGRTEILRSITVDPEEPPDEVFELRSLGIPEQTGVLDRGLAQQIGTWTGEYIEVEPGYQNLEMPEENSKLLYVLCGAAVIVISTVVAVKSGLFAKRS